MADEAPQPGPPGGESGGEAGGGGTSCFNVGFSEDENLKWRKSMEVSARSEERRVHACAARAAQAHTFRARAGRAGKTRGAGERRERKGGEDERADGALSVLVCGGGRTRT
eukprot:235420-Rhodomonas_salina.2